MKTTYFNITFQKTAEGKTIMVAVIPDDLIGENLPNIYEVQAFMMPQTIYTGTYPQIKINTDTLKARQDLKGLGIAGIVIENEWYNQEIKSEDILGIGLRP